jgi:putative membrane protein
MAGNSKLEEPDMMWGDGWHGAAWGWFSLMHFLWMGLLILALVGLVRWALGAEFGRGRRREEDRALEVLRERYARGDISREEFEERKRALKD